MVTLTAKEQERWPEYAKYREAANDPEVQRVGEFIEWVSSCKQAKGRIVFAEELASDDSWPTDRLYRTQPNIEKLLCQWLGIDYEEAKRQQHEAQEEALASVRGKHRDEVF